MIKVLPINKTVTGFHDVYVLKVTLGYGEHCDDTYTSETVIINDDKALHPKYEDDDPENGFPIDEKGFPDFRTYVSVEEAEKMCVLLNRLVKKSGDEHITLNDGINDEWFKKDYGMTQEEVDEFRTYYEKFETTLFNPRIEHNWYGLVGCDIYYYDMDGNKHNCEII